MNEDQATDIKKDQTRRNQNSSGLMTQSGKYQAVILENEELPKLFLDFLNIRHLPSLPKTESCGSFEETESEESSKLSHQPVLLFLRDPYVLPTANDHFPNVVIEGVLHGIFYPHLQPRFIISTHFIPTLPSPLKRKNTSSLLNK
ncbi:sorting nexin-24 isoform X5 [Sarcophilus harrisii]|uniref:sorting nexin-24 isoform X5 n=1 Tax=Sarcophilus harrisii TaxID=9305 RepID=UPI001301B412|nr:sorting nexin-24 isoform X5 [Sarcophilus harrisii]